MYRKLRHVNLQLHFQKTWPKSFQLRKGRNIPAENWKWKLSLALGTSDFCTIPPTHLTVSFRAPQDTDATVPLPGGPGTSIQLWFFIKGPFPSPSLTFSLLLQISEHQDPRWFFSTSACSLVLMMVLPRIPWYVLLKMVISLIFLFSGPK